MAEPQMTPGSKFEHSRGRIDNALQKIWEHMDLWFHTRRIFHVTPWAGSIVTLYTYNLNELDRSPLDNATHKISEL